MDTEDYDAVERNLETLSVDDSGYTLIGPAVRNRGAARRKETSLNPAQITKAKNKKKNTILVLAALQNLLKDAPGYEPDSSLTVDDEDKMRKQNQAIHKWIKGKQPGVGFKENEYKKIKDVTSQTLYLTNFIQNNGARLGVNALNKPLRVRNKLFLAKGPYLGKDPSGHRRAMKRWGNWWKNILNYTNKGKCKEINKKLHDALSIDPRGGEIMNELNQLCDVLINIQGLKSQQNLRHRVAQDRFFSIIQDELQKLNPNMDEDISTTMESGKFVDEIAKRFLEDEEEKNIICTILQFIRFAEEAYFLVIGKFGEVTSVVWKQGIESGAILKVVVPLFQAMGPLLLTIASYLPKIVKSNYYIIGYMAPQIAELFYGMWEFGKNIGWEGDNAWNYFLKEIDRLGLVSDVSNKQNLKLLEWCDFSSPQLCSYSKSAASLARWSAARLLLQTIRNTAETVSDCSTNSFVEFMTHQDPLETAREKLKSSKAKAKASISGWTF